MLGHKYVITNKELDVIVSVYYAVLYSIIQYGVTARGNSCNSDQAPLTQEKVIRITHTPKYNSK